MEPRVGDFCFFLPEVFEVKAVVRPQTYRVIGVNTKYRAVATLGQIFPTNIVERADISPGEVERMRCEIQSLRSQLASQQTAGKQRGSESNAESQRDEYQKKIKLLQEELQNAVQQRDNELNRLRRELQNSVKLREKLNNAELQRDEIQRENNRLQNELQNAGTQREKNCNAEVQRDQLSEDLKRLHTELQNAGKQREADEALIQQLRNELRTEVEKREELSVQYCSLKVDLISLDGRKDVQEVKIKTLEADLEKAKSEREDSETEKIEMFIKLESAEMELKEKTEEAERQRRLYMRAQKRLEKLSAKSLFDRSPTLYELLYVTESATTEQIKKNFKLLATICHPDKGGSDQYFKMILKAKSILEADDVRKVYDNEGFNKAKDFLNSKMDC